MTSESQNQSVAAVLADLRQRRPLGDGLLPATFGAAFSDLASDLADAHAHVSTTRRGNHLLWQDLRETFAAIRDEYAKLGLSAPPFSWDSLWARLDLPVPSTDPVAHSRFAVALVTNYGPRFCDHLVYRLQHAGNVQIYCCGPTGLAKSSCMLSVMDWLKPIQRGRLANYLCFDVYELPGKLSATEPGGTVLLDELITTVGEGSKAVHVMLENLEDTLRASQRNLIISTPRHSKEHTVQVVLEAIAWNVERQYTLFLVWIDGVPHGVMAIPWAPSDLYEKEYSPWKAVNVARSLAAQFKDNRQTAKAVMELFEDERVVEYLWLGVNKPKMGDFNTAIVLFFPGLLAQAQVERMAKFAYESCYSYQRLAEKFEFFFGVKPNAGFLKIAEKCYEE